MGYPVTNTSSTLFSRDTYICRAGLGPNMRCFECKGPTITKYHRLYVWKYCQECDWSSYPTKIPEAIK